MKTHTRTGKCDNKDEKNTKKKNKKKNNNKKKNAVTLNMKEVLDCMERW